MERQAREVAIMGGNRAGKTTVGAKIVLDMAINRPGQRIYAVTQDLDLSVRVQQRKIAELLPKKSVSYSRYDIVNGFAHRKIVFKNESAVIFKSYDQEPETFQGDDLDCVWMDELCPYSIYKECKMRLIDRGGTMFFTMTPWQGLTEVMNKIMESEKNLKFYLNTYQNPYLNKEEIDQTMNELDEDERITRTTGVPLSRSGLIFPQFYQKVHVVDPDKIKIDSNWILYNVLDPADRKPWALGWYAINLSGDVFCIDEWPRDPFEKMKSDSRTISDYVNMIGHIEKELFNKYKVPVVERIIDPNFGNTPKRFDHDWQTLKQVLNQHNLFFRDGVDDLDLGHQKVREYLNYDKDRPISHNNSPKLFMFRGMRNHIYSLSHYSWDDYKRPEERAPKQRPKDKWKDFCDVVRYLLMDEPNARTGYKGQYKVRKLAA